jgi:hypothetical protein
MCQCWWRLVFSGATADASSAFRKIELRMENQGEALRSRNSAKMVT